MQERNIITIINDTEIFLNRLQYKYNIRYKRVTPQEFYGEFISQRGEYYTLGIRLSTEGTKVVIAKEGKQVIYQKDYITRTDKQALSKSVGVDRYIERLISA